MKKPFIPFASNGPSGNIYALLALCREALSDVSFGEMRDRVFSSGSYEDALGIIREYVDLLDLSGRY